eukprot:Skav207691  [mRNA]  locus=scaffold3057:41308:42762:- [translate_table: standard]
MDTPMSPFRRAVTDPEGNNQCNQQHRCVVQSPEETETTSWRQHAVLELQKQRRGPRHSDSLVSVDSLPSRSLVLDVAAATRGSSPQDALWPSMPTVEMHGEEMSLTEQQAGERMSWCSRAWLLGWLEAKLNQPDGSGLI